MIQRSKILIGIFAIIRRKTFWLFMLVMAFTWLHGFRTPSDYSMQNKLSEQLLRNKKIELPGMASPGDRVCFLPPYAGADSIKSQISDSQRSYLRIRIDYSAPIGMGDHVWWIAVLTKEEVSAVYRMSPALNPDFKDAKCVESTAKLVLTRKVDCVVFFDISER